MEQNKQLETFLTICAAGVVIYLLHPIKYILFGVIVLAFVGLFIPTLTRLIHVSWMKLAEGMGYVSSKVILSLVFFFVLLPMALLRKIGGKDILYLKNTQSSFYKGSEREYSQEDFDNMW